ncbi:hypothetical protein PHILAsVB114_06055 [Candidatus Planktophila limnetica]|uniref:Uncharacterized protein n=1 Tax=Candidatus Planktophila limnetica TaxID=573600 RepID=A0A249LGB6_9ACTN|nr:hypothetical protein [Candidatus Planktophila limnetica]ASY28168.1 hypothetical protein PHILAsVB114_06055 [Candidatus Planktophila limnetica]
MSNQNQELRRKLAIIVLRLEGFLILGIGVFLIVKGLTSKDSIEWFVISGELCLVIGGGAGLLFAAKGFKDKKMYGRAPAVLANLIALGVAKYMYDGGLWWTALPLALLAAITIFLAVSVIPEKKSK